MQGNDKQRNQQANLPLFNIEMMTTSRAVIGRIQ
jgi:hypothetical protein